MKRFALVLLWLCCFGSAHAQVYKCRHGGVIAYQDKPCPSGTQLGKITLEAPAVVTGKPPSSSLPPPKPVSDTPPAPSPPRQLPAAANYKCTRYDGMTYFSGSNMPNRHYVAVTQLKTPPPGVSPAKIWVTDSCAEAPLKEACDYYDQQIDFVSKQARSAQTLARQKLEREATRLRTISNSRCKAR